MKELYQYIRNENNEKIGSLIAFLYKNKDKFEIIFGYSKIHKYDLLGYDPKTKRTHWANIVQFDKDIAYENAKENAVKLHYTYHNGAEKGPESQPIIIPNVVLKELPSFFKRVSKYFKGEIFRYYIDVSNKKLYRDKNLIVKKRKLEYKLPPFNYPCKHFENEDFNGSIGKAILYKFYIDKNLDLFKEFLSSYKMYVKDINELEKIITETDFLLCLNWKKMETTKRINSNVKVDFK
jgi:hypothetical protein